jgi:hypothetical protein
MVYTKNLFLSLLILYKVIKIYVFIIYDRFILFCMIRLRMIHLSNEGYNHYRRWTNRTGMWNRS